jgi:tetratricopeptide (TPR) repeat protein
MNAGERAQIIDHISRCASCSELSRSLGHRSLTAPDGVGRESHDRSWRRAFAALAAVVLAVAGWSWLVRVPSVERAVLTAIPAADSDRAPVTTLAAVAPWALLDRAPDVRLPAALTLEMRGEPNRNEVFLREFGSAIAPYREGRYADAAMALEKVTAAYPDTPEAWFYLAVSRLHAGDPANAVDGLRKAAASSEVGDEANWLEAVALERSGQHDAARRRLDDLCARPGPSRTRACDALSGVR